MAIYGKELNSPKIRRFEYTVLNKKYILDVETRLDGKTNREMYDFWLCRKGYGFVTYAIGMQADQTKAKIDPKYYKLEDALEIVECNLMDYINIYEDELAWIESQ